MSWLLRIKTSDGLVSFDQFDNDELGTLDDKLTGLFITDLDDIDKIIIERRKK